MTAKGHKPICKAVFCCTESADLKSYLRGLAGVKHTEKSQAFLLNFGGHTRLEHLWAQLERDGEVQAVILDARFSETVVELRKIHAFRPEIELYVLIPKALKDQVNALCDEPIKGYFLLEEQDFRSLERIVASHILERCHTPFFDQWLRYTRMAVDAWHTPGHSSGDSLRGSPWVGDFYDFLGANLFYGDLSVSVRMLDSLLEPTGVILQAQEQAALAFGAKQTYFATGGTSTANKVILQTLLSPGDKLLLDRNCHKSVHHGVILSGAHPIYLDSSVNTYYGMFGPIPQNRILAALEGHHDAKALILTSCTYDGFRYDLAPIVRAAHAKGIKVIIDEAWYGHARFHPEFRPTALEAGADYVTQSTHKLLSALSQSGMIHIGDPEFNPHRFRESFNMHTSTSPQYAMIASLDVGRKQASLEGYKLLSNTLELAAELRLGINATSAFRVLELDDLLPDEVLGDGIRLDPTKLTVDISQSGYAVEELEEILLERYSIQVEKSTFNTLTLLLTLGTTRSKCMRLLDALERLAREHRPPRPLVRIPEIPAFTELNYLPRDTFFQVGEILALYDQNGQVNAALEGRTAADQIVPYPPGIPVLVPGQRITLAVLEYLRRVSRIQRQLELHGVQIFEGIPHLRVLTALEETGLNRLTPFPQTSQGLR